MTRTEAHQSPLLCLSISMSLSKDSRVWQGRPAIDCVFLHWVRTGCKLGVTGLDRIRRDCGRHGALPQIFIRGSLTTPPPPTNLPAGEQKGNQVLIQPKPPLLLKPVASPRSVPTTSAWQISFNNQTTQIWFPSPIGAFHLFSYLLYIICLRFNQIVHIYNCLIFPAINNWSFLSGCWK